MGGVKMIKLFLNILKRVGAVIAAVTIIIANIAEYPPKDNYYPDVSTQNYGLVDALLRTQGVTTDGESYIFSSNYCLLRTELDGKTVLAKNLCAIPLELQKLGCKHIGGISYYDGKIYAPIEDSKVFKHLYIGVYDSETLKLLNYYPLPLELQENGVPWAVADGERGYLYTARRDYIEVINVFDINTLEFIKTIPLSNTVHKVQGGEMYQGILYLSVSRDQQAIFAINPLTGQVQKAFDRNLVDGAEGEGMTILPTPDGALFHVLDIGKLRISVHFRHYAFDTNSLVWD
jgi:hypothetical protein